MLHYKSVEKQTMDLLKELMEDNLLKNFLLVGGTALALKLGHRLSIDIDLFTNQPFDSSHLAEHLHNKFKFSTDFLAKNTLKGEINGIMVDCIAHQYQWIDNHTLIDNIRIAGFKDVAAMKMNAIVGNGTRLKDFIDLAYLSTKLPLNEMLSGFQKKYDSNPVLAIKAMVYFEDVNLNEPIRMMQKKPFQWTKIKNRLQAMVNSPNKLFPEI
jgi:hypothetical protein